eukprot:s145_g6.t1
MPRSPGEESTGARGAVYVMAVESHGLWLTVGFLGSNNEAAKKDWQRQKVHICYPEDSGGCPLGEENWLHLERFLWVPPRGLCCPLVSAAAKKKVAQGVQLALKAAKDAGSAEPGEHGEPSNTEKRLTALRFGRRHVTFAPETRIPGKGTLADVRPGMYPDGILRKPATSSVLASVPGTAVVKSETVDLTRSRTPSRTPEPRRKKTKIRDALAQAAVSHQQSAVKKERKDKDRSRSRTRKKRRERRKRDESDSGSSTSSDGISSGSSSLHPPLWIRRLAKVGPQPSTSRS